jgi:uncharacterized protein involved in cysteine biosynthesis
LFSALSKAFDQLGDPRIQKIIGLSIGIAIAVFAGLVILGIYLVDWVTGFNGIWGDVARWLGGFAAFVIAWFTFPIVAAGTAAIFADRVVDAVMARHYPGRWPMMFR